MEEQNKIRIKKKNESPILENKKFILYWMQAYRRFESNHAFDYAVHLAKKYDKELVVYEGLRSDYPYSSERLHKFILEGFRDNAKEATRLGINYWPFVETKTKPGRGLLKKVSKDACAIVSDDFPCFIIPEQNQKLANKVECAYFVVDGNSCIPLSHFPKPASAARILRPWIHKAFGNYFPYRAKSSYSKRELAKLNKGTKAPFEPYVPEQMDSTISNIIFKEHVGIARDMEGGRIAGLKKLNEFVKSKLALYLEGRSNPNPPEFTATSGLSAYLHFGYISSEELVEASLGSDWTVESLHKKKPGDRETFYSNKNSTNHFLDELLTWREIGYLFFWDKPEFGKNLTHLPDWVKKNMEKHKKDRREFNYTLEEWESAKTHDDLWNAAQIELVKTGRLHNYMRMLWGKKIIEWSPTYEYAFETMEYLNHKYAYDGRNPNSYSGLLWCFGLFDRPWFPERNVFGNIRYMSSDSTKRKFKMQKYLEYTNELSKI